MTRPGGAALVVFLLGSVLTATACAANRKAASTPAAPAAASAPSLAPASAPAVVAPPAAAPATASPVAALPAANPWLDPAREVLVQHCGRCHRGDLPTSLPKALAVFDLTRPIWNERLAPPQYDGILTRVRESSAIAPDEVAAVEAFVRCARDGACGAS